VTTIDGHGIEDGHKIECYMYIYSMDAITLAWKKYEFIIVQVSANLFKNWMHFFVVLLTCKSVDEALYTKIVPQFTLLHAYKTTKKNAFNSYDYI
jgi:hypothetical protein